MKYLVAVIATLIFITGCRTGKLPTSNSNADILYEKHHYYDAAQMYNKLIKKQKDETKKREQTLKLADCYRQMNYYTKAAIWYKKAIEQNPDKPEFLYLYADLLMSQNNYSGALETLQIYQKEVPGDNRADKKIEICNKAIKLDIDGSRFNLKPIVQLNTQFNEYAPIYINQTLYFTSDREGTTGGLKYPRLGTYYSDVFISADENGTLSKPKPMGNTINTSLNEGSSAFNKSGNVMVFTQCSGQGFDSSCVLLISTKQRGNWSKPEVIDFGIKGDYMFGQPTLNEQGNQIIFSSNMPSGYGGHDLYSTTLKNGAWARPQNLGPKINSNGDEMFPYLLNEYTLYFSSNGHPGFGALDVFMAVKKKDKWRNPQNLLPPVNSGGDDFGMTFKKDNSAFTEGFLSSNRNGQGDDIFSFEIVTPPLSTVCGTVYDKKTK
ncbi:MAG: tetratricopeptide repeat protein, partial [Bacteroidia bacterium]